MLESLNRLKSKIVQNARKSRTSPNSRTTFPQTISYPFCSTKSAKNLGNKSLKLPCYSLGPLASSSDDATIRPWAAQTVLIRSGNASYCTMAYSRYSEDGLL